MNTAKIWQTESTSSENTSAIAERLGRNCRGGELILLKSDLGGGKTTFVKGLAKGLESNDQVGSPTYTINRVYTCHNGLELQHFDFYRLQDAGIVAHELSEVIHDSKTVIAVEWGDIVSQSLPADRVDVVIEQQTQAEDNRLLKFSYPEGLDYLFEGVAL